MKDIGYALQLTHQLDIGSPFGTLADHAFQKMCDLGFDQQNESAMLKLARLGTIS